MEKFSLFPSFLPRSSEAHPPKPQPLHALKAAENTQDAPYFSQNEGDFTLADSSGDKDALAPAQPSTPPIEGKPTRGASAMLGVLSAHASAAERIKKNFTNHKP